MHYLDIFTSRKTWAAPAQEAKRPMVQVLGPQLGLRDMSHLAICPFVKFQAALPMPMEGRLPPPDLVVLDQTPIMACLLLSPSAIKLLQGFQDLR
jgi:hypothetical protein